MPSADYLHLIDFAAKSLAILGATAAAAYGLRRKSAATVHRVWTLGFVALIVAPAAGLALPQQAVQIAPPSAVASLSPVAVAPQGAKAVRALRAAPPSAGASIAPLTAAASSGAEPSGRARPSTPLPGALEGPAPARPWTLSALAAAAWALVAVALLVRLTIHHALLAQLLRRCTPVAGDSWARALADAARRLALRRPVRLLTHAEAATPATAGTWRPIVLLPVDASGWTAAQRHSVLLHELAHVKRCDVLAQAAAAAACAVHWFNPLAWYGLAQMRKLRELACDDLVLAGGQPPCDYAQTLLNVARTYRPRSLAGAVGMARGTNVERRIHAILDSARDRLPMSRRGGAALTVLAALLILGLGSVRLDRQSAAAAGVKPADSAKEAAAPEQDPDERTLDVFVTDEAGAPLPGARVHASIWEVEGGKDYPNRDFTADERGELRVPIPRRLRILRLWPAHAGYVPEFINFSEGTHDEGKYIPQRLHFKLARGAKLSGRVVDEAGQPIVGAKVAVKVEAREPAWGRDPDPMVSTWLTDSDFNSSTPTTDADGRWSIDNAPAPAGDKDFEFRLKVVHDDYFRESQWGEFQRQQGVTTAMLRDGTATIVLKGGVAVEGAVVDAEGKPVTKGWVVWSDNPYFDQGDWETALEKGGHFRTLPLAPGEHPITVVAPGYAAERRLVDVKPGMEALKFALAPGRRISIRFVDVKGAPVPRAGVYLGGSSSPDTWKNSNALHNQSGSGTPDYGIPRRAGDDGIYHWDWAPEGAVKYRVGAKGYAPQNLSLVPKDAPHVVTLGEERMAVGVVTDAKTGKPIAEFTAMPVIVFRQDFYHTRSADAKPGRDGRYELPLTGSGDPTDRYRVRFEADGYRSLVSEQSFGPLDGRATLDVALEPAPARTGQVVDADGQPVERAVVLEASPSDVPNTYNNEPENFGTRSIRTDAAGKFSFGATSEPVLLRALHDRGFAEIRRAPDEPFGVLKLQPWARLEGRLVQDGRPVGDQSIMFYSSRQEKLTEPRFQDSHQVQTDAEGRFAFDRLPPIAGSVRAYLGPWEESPLTSSESAPLNLAPGERRTIVLGGAGAVVTGRVVPTGRGDVPLDAHWSLNHLVSRNPSSPLPVDFPQLGFTPGEGAPLELAWLDDPHYQQWQATRRNYFVKLSPEGKLRISGVPAGAYDLVIQLYEQPAGCLVQTVGRKIVPVEVTAADASAGEKSLGDIEVPCTVGPRVGENMQAYKFLDADGREQTVFDLQGRHVLMHVWASWCAPCLESLPDMQASANELADRPVTFVGLNVDADKEQGRSLATEKGWNWAQTYLGKDSDAMRQLAVSSVPAYFLIGPDGNLVASSSQWPEIKKALETSLTDR